MNTTISVRIPDTLTRELNQVAKETERPKSFLIKKAIESYLEEMADLQIASDRLRDPNDEIISSRELRQSLGL